MTPLSRVLERVFKLPPALTRDVAVVKDLRVPMRDGVVLLADRYAPRGGDERLPAVVIRGPYGRRGGSLWGRAFARRGYAVLVQGVRGTDGSGGVLDPFRQEKNDGLDTLAWIEGQPWYSGELVTFGASYLGFTQWAIAAGAGNGLKAMAVQLSFSDLRDVVYPGGAFSLETFAAWMSLMSMRNLSVLGYLPRLLTGDRKFKRALNRLPLEEVDEAATGKKVPYFWSWLEHEEASDPWWNAARHSDAVAGIEAPVHLLGGWHDFFLPALLRDYRALRDARKRPYLTVGPWHHSSFGHTGVAIREALAFFDGRIKSEEDRLRAEPVRIYVTGAEEWRDYPDFPPPNVRNERWYLHGGGTLTPEPPGESPPDRYRYDPADPTPSVGGPLGPGLNVKAGPADNRKLEARPDVLVYTSEALHQDLEVIGPVIAELFVRSSLRHTDFFARLCDVHASDKSVNVCDALLRASPRRPEIGVDGTMRLRIELWPTAHRFKRNHRLRLQVSSGAHPRYARNTGSGEPLSTATKLVPADQEVFHDPERPSSVVLAVSG